MSTNRILGIALIVAGIGLLYWGYSESQGFSSSISSAVSGSPSDNVMIKYIGGGVALVVGLFLTKKL